MTLVWTDGSNPDFIRLAAELDAVFREQLGDRQAAFDPYNGRALLGPVALLYDGPVAVACAALKPGSDGDVESKRVYVQPAYRRHGLAKELVVAMEARACSLGYRRLLLETNPTFLSAVTLYRACGFEPVEAFGPYVGMATLCMGKALHAM